MSKYSIQEKEILNKCNVKSFKNITKDNILNLYSQLKDFSPEIQTKVLDEIGKFSRIVSDKIKDYKDIAIESLKSAKDSESKLFSVQLIELENLQKVLESDDLDFSQKIEILDRMSAIENNAKDAKKENNNFLLNILSGVGQFFLSCLGLITIIFIGKNIFKKHL